MALLAPVGLNAQNVGLSHNSVDWSALKSIKFHIYEDDIFD